MINKLNIYYDGWGEHWHWGSLWLLEDAQKTIVFEYSDAAMAHGLELSKLNLPLAQKITQDHPRHQDKLPGILADCLPDGWGRLLMDRWFRQQQIPPHQVTALDRLTYLGRNAMGAFSFEPEQSLLHENAQNFSLQILAAESQKIMQEQASDLLNELVLMGGSPHGARPKVLLYRSQAEQKYSNFDFPGAEAWLVKFPAQNEKPEVAALEKIYAVCAEKAGLQLEQSEYFNLGNNLTAFGSKRFDRAGNLRVPMHTLAGYLHDDFRVPGCDYETLIRATAHISYNSQQQIQRAFRQAVFNVVFNNRDDHTKNFSFVLNQQQEWQLSPAYDLTFNEGPNGYHQMSIMGEAMNIEKQHLIKLAKIAGISKPQTEQIIEQTCGAASALQKTAQDLLPGEISKSTLQYVQAAVDKRIKQLTAS